MSQYLQLDHLFNMMGHKWGVSTWLVLYLLIVVYYAFFKNSTSNNLRCFARSMVLMCVFTCCPLVVNMLVIHFTKSGHEYSRIAWGMLSLPAIGYAVTELVSNSNKTFIKQLKTGLLIGAGCLLLAGVPIQSYFKVPDNVYKVPDESIEMIELMREHKNSDDSLVAIGFILDSTEDISPEEYVIQGMRLYDSFFQYARVDEKTLKNKEYAYIITEQSFPEGLFDDYGYEWIGKTSELALYQRVGE